MDIHTRPHIGLCNSHTHLFTSRYNQQLQNRWCSLFETWEMFCMYLFICWAHIRKVRLYITAILDDHSQLLAFTVPWICTHRQRSAFCVGARLPEKQTKHPKNSLWFRYVTSSPWLKIHLASRCLVLYFCVFYKLYLYIFFFSCQFKHLLDIIVSQGLCWLIWVPMKVTHFQ